MRNPSFNREILKAISHRAFIRLWFIKEMNDTLNEFINRKIYELPNIKKEKENAELWRNYGKQVVSYITYGKE